MSKMISVARLKDHILKGDTKEMIRIMLNVLPYQIKRAEGFEVVQKGLLKRFVMVKELEATLKLKGVI
jgi:hypothetical protein